MTNLSKSMRSKLAHESKIAIVNPIAEIKSSDEHTIKTLFALPDGKQIEAVLMKYDKRRTICISTQVGCAMACPFCATGHTGFERNLSVGEIVDQVLYYSRLLAKHNEVVTNVVFMGMGEPFANYVNTWQAIRHLNDSQGFDLGARKMTISTVGLVPAIRRMSHEPEQVGLAVSIHAPIDAIRDTIVPVNKRYPLNILMNACRDYIEMTNRRVTFEYVLMDGVNDNDEHADQLAQLLKGLLCHVNLIPLNPASASLFRRASAERVYAFRDRLQQANIPTTIRLPRGVDIQAGCGQLRAQN
ncbi:MAG: 23S rRNA (adenine(2503)-C(2))-methyltransferase [Anaerolineaceae bacterium 4572_78]|nr:MAG: 23S rRNA (adenine(2503)-C(2))-methyltransferase [Anaerolineaceae bacterium 4572_78]